MTPGLVLCFAWLATAQAAPDPPALARAELSPSGTAWVGQRVTLAVTLFSPTYFASASDFEVPQVPGVLILRPDGSPTVGSEAVGDATYTTQRHEFAVFAQRPGVIRIPPIAARFASSAGFDKPATTNRVATPALEFTAKLPPGAEGLATVICSTDLSVDQSWNPDPNPGPARVGDAFTLTISLRASDVPGMALPALRFGPIDGLGVYSKAPEVADESARGDLTGRRLDSVTYVCERPGRFVIPRRTLTWWALPEAGLRRAEIPGRSFAVAAAQAPAGATLARPSPRIWPEIVGGIVLLVLGLSWMARGRLLAIGMRWRHVRTDSEWARFARFRRSCRRGDPRDIEQALAAWWDRLPENPLAAPLAALPDLVGDPALAAILDALRDRLYGHPGRDPSTGWSARGLLRRATQARRQFRRTRDAAGSRPGDLAPLNPTATAEARPRLDR